MIEKNEKKPALQERSRETVRSILEAAARILGKEGVARATTNRIAEVAGVSVGSLYQFFRNKDSILDQVLAGTLEDALVRILKTVEDTAEFRKSGVVQVRPFIIALVENIADGFAKRSALSLALFEHFSGRVGLRAMISMDKRITDIFRKFLQDTGMRIRPENPEAAIFVLLHAIRSVVFMTYTTQKTPEETVRLKGELIELCVRYLEPVDEG